MWVTILIACIVSGILYRLGGIGKPFNTKFRDAGCPSVLLILTWLVFGFSWSYWWLYLIAFGLSWGALTTYWDNLFGYDNFWFHGFMCGVAGIPLIWCGVPWWIVVSRIAICAVGMGLWSKLIGWDDLEEFGRGVFFII